MSTRQMTSLEITAHELELEAAGAIGKNVLICHGCRMVREFPNNDVMKNCVTRTRECEVCRERSDP